MATMFFEDYPVNYEHVPFSERMRILVKFKNNDFPSYEAMIAYRDELESRNIFVEYGWVGHRDEWFLATMYDACMQEDYVMSCD